MHEVRGGRVGPQRVCRCGTRDESLKNHTVSTKIGHSLRENKFIAIKLFNNSIKCIFGASNTKQLAKCVLLNTLSHNILLIFYVFNFVNILPSEHYRTISVDSFIVVLYYGKS